MAYTKEPWRASTSACDAIVADETGGHRMDEDSLRYYGGELVAESIGTENRRRIVACINACAGLSTESLERIAAEGMRLVLP